MRNYTFVVLISGENRGNVHTTNINDFVHAMPDDYIAVYEIDPVTSDVTLTQYKKRELEILSCEYEA